MFRKHICPPRLCLLAAAAGLAVTVLEGNLFASPVYTLGSSRYFPAGAGTSSANTSGTLTPVTANSFSTSFSSNPGDPMANLFDALDTVAGSPFRLGVRNSLSISQATGTSFSNWLSGASAGVSESGVSVTGGSGTAYLLPTFRFRGSFNNGNPSIATSVDTCDGNNSCVVKNIAFNNGGSQNVDLLYTPAIDSATAFQFGASFTISYFFAALDIISGGSTANPGGPVVSDFGMELVSVQVVDANGTPVPGAQIHSQLVDIASAPEPGSAALCIAGLLVAAAQFGVRAARNRPPE